MLSSALKVAAFGLILIVPASHAQEPEVPALATRCNAVEWNVPMGSSDTFPPGIRTIQRELEMRDAAVVKEIATSLPHSLHLRRIAPRVFGKWPSDATRTLLIALVGDPDLHVACLATIYLGDVGGKEVVPRLVESVNDPRTMVRHNALNALGSFGAADRGFAAAKTCLEREDNPQWLVDSVLGLMAKLGGSRHIEQAIVILEGMQANAVQANRRQGAARVLAILRAKLAR